MVACYILADGWYAATEGPRVGGSLFSKTVGARPARLLEFVIERGMQCSRVMTQAIVASYHINSTVLQSTIFIVMFIVHPLSVIFIVGGWCWCISSLVSG